jgi:hypothetical protein
METMRHSMHPKLPPDPIAPGNLAQNSIAQMSASGCWQLISGEACLILNQASK